MTDHTDQFEETRRSYMKAIAASAALGATGLAGCSGDGGGDTGGSSPTATSGAALEVVHGWVGGDGANAIQALEEAFAEEHPDISKNFKGIGASANVSLNSTVTRRLANNNPMSSFANWPGKNLERYRGALMDLEEDVWDAGGLKDKIHEATVEQHKFNDKMPGVPIGSHRMNNLFVNLNVWEEAGVDPAEMGSMDDLMSALETISSNTDKTPMIQAMKAPWTNLQLFAQIITSQDGVEAYMDFINGDPNRDAVVRALETEKEIFQNYINDDANSISFTTANQGLIDGNAACIHQGNWAYGMYRSDDQFNYKDDWDWIPFPGTEGIYFFHLDSFMAPADNPSREATVTWQKFVGTKKAQISFNNPKGSVPLRTDIDSNKLTDFLKITYEDLLAADQLPPTIAHGLAVTPKQLGDAKSAFGDNFMGPFNVSSTADALISAVSG